MKYERKKWEGESNSGLKWIGLIRELVNWVDWINWLTG